jgi:hypothetical protein
VEVELTVKAIALKAIVIQLVFLIDYIGKPINLTQIKLRNYG